MRKWVKRAAIALGVCLLGLIALSEGSYHYVLRHIEGRPSTRNEPPPEVFLAAARFMEGSEAFETCRALQLGALYIAAEFLVDAPLSRHHCGRFEYRVSASFLFRTKQHGRSPAREAALGIWVARHLTREQMLLAWTQYARFGHGNLQESSEWFFGKPPAALTKGESITLLLFHQFGGRKLPQERRDHVLDRMHDEGLLSDAVWSTKRARPLPGITR